MSQGNQSLSVQPSSESIAPSPDAIRVRHLVKRFGDVTAVNDISFTVATGELFGFLGPNGAGKTTTINMLTGLARPVSGEVWIHGIDCSRNPKAAQHLMGIVPDESNLYPELTGFQNLCFCGALYGMRREDREQRAWALLQQLDLADAAMRKFAGYSRGMKRRLTIAAGIIHSPPILFLDEPTTGIDIASARRVRQMIGELNRTGTTVFLTTHYIEEAERLCRRVAFIVSGRIVKDDSVCNLMAQLEGRHVVEFSIAQSSPRTESALAAAFPSTQFSTLSPSHLRASSLEPIPVGTLVVFMEQHGTVVQEARVNRPSLEDVFVQTTGLAAQEMRREKERSGGGRGGPQ